MQRHLRNWPFFAYVLLSLAALYFHECWRDEIQALLIAKAPIGIKDFFWETLHFEGHPFLWFYTLKIFSPFGVHPLGLQLANSLFMIGTVALFWWKFPLPSSLKALFVFNYYFLFEYGVVARSYTLGIFLLFTYLAFYDSPQSRYRNLSLVALVLSIQVSIYSLMIACALFIPYFYKEIKHNKKSTSIATFCILLSVLLAILQMIPAEGQSMNSPALLKLDWSAFLQVFSRLGEVFLYIPPVQFYPRLWPLPFPFMPALVFLRGTLALFAISSFCYFLYKRKPTLCFAYLLGTCSILAFSYIKFLGSIRHMAHLLVLIALFYWLAQKERFKELKNETSQFLFLVASLSALSGAILYCADIVYPFSDAKNASKVVSASDKLIIGLPDFAVSTLSGYLDGKEIYYLNTQRSGTYIKWDHPPNAETVNFKESILETLDKYKTNEALFVTNNRPLAGFLQNLIPNDIIYESNICIVPDECYIVAKIRRAMFKNKKD
ncbi:MAG: hypothetical protein R3A80_03080 [Bdellovibrionota bacterium]